MTCVNTAVQVTIIVRNFAFIGIGSFHILEWFLNGYTGVILNERKVHTCSVSFPGPHFNMTPVLKEKEGSKGVVKDNGENLAEKYHETTNIGKHCKEN